MDCIFDYLDVHSLCSLAETSIRCKELVESYIKMHAQKTFTITDEFKSYDSLNECIFFDTQIFAQYITDLEIDNFYTIDLAKVFIHQYKSINKLSIYNNAKNQFRNSISIQKTSKIQLQTVQHFIFLDIKHKFDYSDLYGISRMFPNVQTIELNNFPLIGSSFQAFKCGALEFCNLKKIIFKYDSEALLTTLKKIFENTRTQLVPIRKIW